MKRNVYLADLGTGSNRNLLPLGLGLMSAYASSLPHLAEAYDFHLHFLRDDPAKIAESMDRPFVVGFACYVWNWRASLRLARKIKERHPNAIIVLGGYSVPKLPDRISALLVEQPQVDVLIHGEGEFTFAEMLARLIDSRDLSTVDGLSFRVPDAPGGFITTGRRDRIPDLDVIPSPFLNGAFDRLMASHGQHVTGVVWETNRGCPFQCTFCDWGNADVNKVKKFDLDRLKAEIDWISRNKVFYIYLADANFGIFYDRDMEIAGRIADQSTANGFPKFMAINWLKNSHEKIVAIADRFAKGGVMTSVTLAMQSFHEPTLTAIKRKNIKHDSLIKLKKEFHDRDLPTYTEMILGLPAETYDTFRHGLNQAMTSRLADHWVFHLCTLLENTEMWMPADRAKYGIESRICSAGISRRAAMDDSDTEVEELVVGTSAMPTPEWRRAYRLGYMSAALYNFRAAFFPINYIQQTIGTEHTAFIEHVIDEVVAHPGRFPRVARALDHVTNQSQAILDSIACLSSVPELGGNLALPHEAILSIMLDDPDQLYVDIEALVLSYFAKHEYEVDPALIAEMIRYQKARMPLWGRTAGSHEIEFAFNIPQYFDAVTRGLPVPELRRTASRMTIEIPETKAKDKFAFNASRTRSGHTIEILKVALGSRSGGTGPSRSLAAA